jgi:hypothetical protein
LRTEGQPKIQHAIYGGFDLVLIEDTTSVGHWGLTRDELRTTQSVSRKVGAVVHSRIFANELLDLFPQFLGIHLLRTIPYSAQNSIPKS